MDTKQMLEKCFAERLRSGYYKKKRAASGIVTLDLKDRVKTFNRLGKRDKRLASITYTDVDDDIKE